MANRTLRKESPMTLTRINRIFAKAFAQSPYPPVLRHANHFEQRLNEYGDKYVWALDKGARQSDTMYTTLSAAIAGTLEDCWEEWNRQRSWEKLTEAELYALRAIPSQVAQLI